MHDERRSAAGLEPWEIAAAYQRKHAAGTDRITPGWDARPGYGIDQGATIEPDPSPAWVHQIRPMDVCSTHGRDEASFTGILGKQDRRSSWLVAGALVAACSLGWAGGFNSHRFLDADAGSSPSPQQTKSSSPVRDTGRKSVARIDGVAPGATSEAGSPAVNSLKLSAPATRTPPRTSKPSAGPAPSSAAPSTAASSVEPASAQRETMLKPVPETRPTTIEGWTVRDVRGDTAVLEGPGGAWKAARGDTVPGVGRIESIVRWGSRWIVATSSGLIATP